MTNEHGDTYVITPKSMKEAGRYFEKKVFGNELAVFANAQNKLEWNKTSEIAG